MWAKYIIRLTVMDVLRKKHVTEPLEFEVSEDVFRRIRHIATEKPKKIRCGDIELRRFWGGV